MSVVKLYESALPFLRHLDRLALNHLGAVTPIICSIYATECKAERQAKRKGKPLSPMTLAGRFSAVEALYELSQFTTSPIPSPPWPDSSALHLAGQTGVGTGQYHSKTPLIPDEVFTALFQAAHALVERGETLLELRDGLDALAAQREGQSKSAIRGAKNRYLKAHGWKGGLHEFNLELLDLRTACYIVVASLSGCRNHELAYVQSNACYRTEDDDGVLYWWMRSQSTKTGVGHTEWMLPEAGLLALRVMDRWAVPYQAMIEAEIVARRAVDPQDPEIAEAQKHRGAVFLGASSKHANQVRTLSQVSCNSALKAFAKGRGLDWDLASHQFRRKFANYAARSKFGDLRYLREHFKHWSQNMTNDAYALNESQEMELYAEIQDELDALKMGLAEQWLNPAEPLAGGYGKNLVAWRSAEENIVIFKDRPSMVRSIAESHAIRSNGHAWCTADDDKCIGNSFEKTRCSGCDNAVIGRYHARLYQQLYNDLKEVLKCDDIGRGGLARVQRDVDRCRDVLISLGYDPEAQAA